MVWYFYLLSTPVFLPTSPKPSLLLFKHTHSIWSIRALLSLLPKKCIPSFTDKNCTNLGSKASWAIPSRSGISSTGSTMHNPDTHSIRPGFWACLSIDRGNDGSASDSALRAQLHLHRHTGCSNAQICSIFQESLQTPDKHQSPSTLLQSNLRWCSSHAGWNFYPICQSSWPRHEAFRLGR